MGTPRKRREKAAEQRKRFKRNRARWNRPKRKPEKKTEEQIARAEAAKDPTKRGRFSAWAYLKAMLFVGKDDDRTEASMGYKAYKAKRITKKQARALGCVIK